MHSIKWLLVLLFSGLTAQSALADTFTIDFEGFADGTQVTNQFPGLVFANATILTAGVDLNSMEYPPTSGINAVIDSGGPISITFTTPVLSFQAFFTYAEPLVLTAFDSMNNQVDQTMSAFSFNYTSSGNPPDELLSLSSAGGISQVLLAGDAGGSSFFMDDVTYTTPSATTPEVSSVTLLSAVLACLCLLRRGLGARLPLNRRG